MLKLPEDPLAEASLLAHYGPGLYQEDSLEVLSTLSAEDFIVPAHKAIFSAMFGLVLDGEEISTPAVLDRLRRAGAADLVGGMVGLANVFQAEDAGRPFKLAEIVKSKSVGRKIIIEASRIAKKASEESEDPIALASEASLCFGALQPQESNATRSTAEHAAMVANGMPLLARDRQHNLFKLGIPLLDGMLRARPGSLGVVAAKTSAGKTSLMIQALLHSDRPAMLSLEMSDWEVDSRLLANLTGVNASLIVNGNAGDMKELAYPETQDLLARIHKECNWTRQDYPAIESAIVKLARRGFKSFIVDYWTLIQVPSLKGNSVSFSLGEISRSFKALAKRLQVGIVLVSQFNREVKDAERPTLENLRESGQLEQDADWILMMWTERPTYQPEDDRVVFCEIQKNRGGSRWVKAKTCFKPGISRFIQVDMETNAPKQSSGSLFN